MEKQGIQKPLEQADSHVKANHIYLREWYVKPDVCLSLGFFFLQVLSWGHMGASRHRCKNGFPLRLPYPWELYSNMPILVCLKKTKFWFQIFVLNLRQFNIVHVYNVFGHFYPLLLWMDSSFFPQRLPSSILSVLGFCFCVFCCRCLICFFVLWAAEF